MDDSRIWTFEESLWTCDAEHYRELVDEHCLMVLPHPPFVFNGEEAIKAVQNTPRWSEATLSDRQVSRPHEGLIVIAYKAEATRGEERYVAYCTSTLRRIEHEVWTVVSHQQTPPLAAKV